MTDTVKPRDAREVEETLRFALDAGKALEIVGGGKVPFPNIPRF